MRLLLQRETRLGCTSAMLQCLSPEERLAVVLSKMLGADDELGARLCDPLDIFLHRGICLRRVLLMWHDHLVFPAAC